jgi:hypothetical protein
MRRSRRRQARLCAHECIADAGAGLAAKIRVSVWADVAAEDVDWAPRGAICAAVGGNEGMRCTASSRAEAAAHDTMAASASVDKATLGAADAGDEYGGSATTGTEDGAACGVTDDGDDRGDGAGACATSGASASVAAGAAFVSSDGEFVGAANDVGEGGGGTMGAGGADGKLSW